MGTVILSPHLDDAVLSCWHILTQPGEVLVVNVFAGVPASPGAPAWWDAYTGATDSGKRMRERIAEDRRALAIAQRTAVNLDFLDEQYREHDQPLTSTTTAIEAVLAPGSHIYAPAAFANHADHALVRAAALKLRARGFGVSLYADLPHATLQGWPSWVTGKRAPASKDLAGAAWDDALAGIGALRPSVQLLDPESLARKLSAVHMYRTQLRGLQELAGCPLSDRNALGYEVTWATDVPARAVGRPARHP
jgi:LmbE family N-acetylglucosaminyl deacetylase